LVITQGGKIPEPNHFAFLLLQGIGRLPAKSLMTLPPVEIFRFYRGNFLIR
jgi:hypothetical protein